jgi:hypothetical protein
MDTRKQLIAALQAFVNDQTQQPTEEVKALCFKLLEVLPEFEGTEN